MNETLTEIYSDNWVNFISKMPVAFAQVREDALIDELIVKQLTSNARGIMIASGGCTSCFLVHSNKFSQLNLVDMNPSQLALNKLKMELSWHYNQERLSILGHHNMDLKQRKDILLNIFNKYQYEESVLGPIDFIATFGPDYIGRYELLFKRLQYEIADNDSTNFLLTLSDIEKQKLFLQENPDYKQKLETAFANVMDLPNLVQIFGKEVTQNSVMPFAKHFYLQTLYAIENIPASTNPYLSQLLAGGFSPNKPYPWLKFRKKTTNTEINYILSSMAEALFNSKDCYDFIHLSNILDWLTEKQASDLLRLSFEKLNEGGFIIIRQLNSKLEIPKLCESLTWDPDKDKVLHKQDRSFFYQKLHIARKL